MNEVPSARGGRAGLDATQVSVEVADTPRSRWSGSGKQDQFSSIIKRWLDERTFQVVGRLRKIQEGQIYESTMLR